MKWWHIGIAAMWMLATFYVARIGMVSATGLDGRLQKCIIEQEEEDETIANSDGDAGDVRGLQEAGGEEPPMHAED